MSSPIIKYFKWDHLPKNLQAVSIPDIQLPNCAEKSAGLRKLLEAKDCFVRASLEIQ